jgi:tRNA threonylcarbamoyladenosine biosynthesis protein TsaE
MNLFRIPYSADIFQAWNETVLFCNQKLSPGIVLVQGDLGAGKTTLIQCLARQRGYVGPVLSPTYNLISCYPSIQIVHLDLYRIQDPQELPALGLDEYIEDYLIFIEWGESFAQYLSPIVAKINIRVDKKSFVRTVEIACLS